MAISTEIVCAFLRWETRIAAAEPSLLRTFIQLPTRCVPGRARTADETPDPLEAAHNRVLRGAFAGHVLKTLPQWAQEDAEAAKDHLLRDYCTNGLRGLYTALVHSLKVTITFERREPIIVTDRPLRWVRALDILDEDALLAFCFVESGADPEDVVKLMRWGLTARLSRAELDPILERGVADMHVHLGGMRNALVLWHALGLGLTSLDKTPRYKKAAIAAIADEHEHAAVEIEKARIERALGQDLKILARLRHPRPDRADVAARGARGVRRLLVNEAMQERRMLAHAWAQLRDSHDDRLEAELEAYLHARHTFLSALRQPVETSPGLGVFRGYFRGVQPIWREDRPPAARFGFSRRLAERDLAEYGAQLAQSRSVLRRVELRRAPPKAPKHYARFLGAWDKVEGAYRLRGPDIDIRFAIHFKRSLEGKRNARSQGADHVVLAQHLDRDSWALQAFRCNESYLDLIPKIARIDLAGAERDGSPLAAAFAIRLLRGEATALQQLEQDDLDEEVHRLWLLLRRQERHISNVPRLGLTCHAGEDSFHPIEGLYFMDMALNALGMCPGDTIGHGLAAGWDLRAWRAARADRRYASRGSVFDALLWLEIAARRRGLATPPDLTTFLDAEFNEIYGHVRNAPLDELFNRRAGPVPDRTRQERGPIDHLFWRECWDTDVIDARKIQDSLPEDLLERLDVITRRMQRRILSEIQQAGVIIELNPSSNVRVSGLGSLAEGPVFTLLNDDAVKSSINTDDPGTFGTRIESEFAIAYAALAPEQDPERALTRIEDIRRNGMSAIQ